ncbi:MAG TPA: phage tail tape measure protein [Streptomyces sp.]|uniref:phage tail tape measure protein n=1 Tax=Streptomyces sp. TaxID=1931 RepID=UPI002C647356|nr:phage tail tape measure protein [Streptomyces sp.]HWU12113.1 phage tail tape measure protein [Streptomyces sp.]
MAGGLIEIEVVPNLRMFPGRLEGGLKSSVGIASNMGKAMGLALAGGATLGAVGLKQVIDIGNEYTANLNELQAVTRATGDEMARVGEVAKDLGADITLPGTSAADAAAAMKELAKGGLDVNEAMTAAKGTLQLAAAAQVEAAQAAEIQSDALNQFGLSAESASHVADVLANTANAASGEITDMANALKYVGPVAKTLNVDIDNVAAAIGLVATQGIRGEQAGTSLRGMLASLAAPSRPAAEALKTLGINAFDAQGKFIGLRAVTEQLAAAKGRLSDAAFTEATATAFGNEGMTIAASLASTGAQAYDDMAKAVSRAGGAAEVAAAKTQGLGGAWEGLKSQAETTGIGIYEAIDGPLERLVRSGAEHLSSMNDDIVNGIETAVASAELFGPRLADAISARGSVIADAAKGVVGPLVDGAVDPMNTALNTGISLWDDFTGVLRNTTDAAEPVAESVGALASASADGDGAVNALASGLLLAGDALEGVSVLLKPVGQLLGVAVDGFTALPGPVQTAVAALVAFRIARSAFGDTQAFSGLRQFSDEMRVQQSLAAANGQQIGRLEAATAAYRTSTVSAVAATRGLTDQMTAVRAGAAAAGQPIGTLSAAVGTLAERSPAIATLRSSFQQAAEGADRFGTAAGIAAASGTGLRLAAGGLVGALGGPVGLAITGAAVGLSLLADQQANAARASAEHQGKVNDLAAMLRESNGVVTESIRLRQAQALQADKIGDSERLVGDAAREAGFSLDLMTEATLGNSEALGTVRDQLQGVIDANKEFATLEDGSLAWTGRYNETGQAAQDLLNEVNGLAKSFEDAERRERELKDAIASGTASMVDATDAGRSFEAAVISLGNATATADDRARALKDAMDALSGGQVDLEAAQVRAQDTLARVRDLFGENIDKTQGWGNALNNAGTALINADGSINVLAQNGRTLSETLRDLRDRAADVAQSTYDFAAAQGDTVPVATEKARAAAQAVRDEFTRLTRETGLTSTELEVLANRAGLVPDNVAIALTTPGDDKTKQELAIVRSMANQIPPDKPIQVRTLSEDAKAKLEELGYKVVTTPNNVTITANSDAANRELNAFLNRPATKTVTVVYSEGKSLGVGPMAVNHDGNYLMPMAAGGLAAAGLKPMAAGIASIVPPNTWRVVGDRMDVPEAYIPLNRSLRSQAILARAANEMGFDLIRRFAVGGIATQTGQAVAASLMETGAATVNVQMPSLEGLAITGRLLVDERGFASIVDGRVERALSATAREVQLRRGRIQ